MKVLTAASIIVAGLIGLCFLRLKISIYLIQEGTRAQGKIVFRILGILGYTVRIPPEGTKEKSSKKLKGDKPKKKHFKNLPSSGKLLDFAKTFLQINLWLIEHINCTRFIWRTKLGFGDAAVTGLGGGLLWSLKGFLLSLLMRAVNSETCKAEIMVTPVFDRETIGTEFDCIFNLRMGYIIIASIRLLVLGIMFNLVLKGVRLRERPSN